MRSRRGDLSAHLVGFGHGLQELGDVRSEDHVDLDVEEEEEEFNNTGLGTGLYSWMKIHTMSWIHGSIITTGYWNGSTEICTFFQWPLEVLQQRVFSPIDRKAKIKLFF